MDPGVACLDQIMSILITMNIAWTKQWTIKLLAFFTAAFCFAHAEHKLIKLKLYNNWSAQTVNNISESAMWNSS